MTRIWKRICVYIWITDSLHCLPETNITLWINCTSIKKTVLCCPSRCVLAIRTWRSLGGGCVSDHRPQSAEPNPWVCVIYYFFLPHSLTLIFVSTDSVLLFGAASRNLFCKLKSIFLYRCSSMHYCKGISKLTYI